MKRPGRPRSGRRGGGKVPLDGGSGAAAGPERMPTDNAANLTIALGIFGLVLGGGSSRKRRGVPSRCRRAGGQPGPGNRRRALHGRGAFRIRPRRGASRSRGGGSIPSGGTTGAQRPSGAPMDRRPSGPGGSDSRRGARGSPGKGATRRGTNAKEKVEDEDVARVAAGESARRMHAGRSEPGSSGTGTTSRTSREERSAHRWRRTTRSAAEGAVRPLLSRGGHGLARPFGASEAVAGCSALFALSAGAAEWTAGQGSVCAAGNGECTARSSFPYGGEGSERRRQLPRGGGKVVGPQPVVTRSRWPPPRFLIRVLKPHWSVCGSSVALSQAALMASSRCGPDELAHSREKAARAASSVQSALEAAAAAPRRGPLGRGTGNRPLHPLRGVRVGEASHPGPGVRNAWQPGAVDDRVFSHYMHFANGWVLATVQWRSVDLSTVGLKPPKGDALALVDLSSNFSVERPIRPGITYAIFGLSRAPASATELFVFSRSEGVKAVLIEVCLDEAAGGWVTPPNRPRRQGTWTYADLACGIGGFSVAAHALDGARVYACDTSPVAVEAFNAAHSGNGQARARVAPIQERATWHGMEGVQLLTAGFPCQPFSKTGKLNGFRDSRGTVVFDLVELCFVLRPDFMV